MTAGPHPGASACRRHPPAPLTVQTNQSGDPGQRDHCSRIRSSAGGPRSSLPSSVLMESGGGGPGTGRGHEAGVEGGACAGVNSHLTPRAILGYRGSAAAVRMGGVCVCVKCTRGLPTPRGCRVCSWCSITGGGVQGGREDPSSGFCASVSPA